MRGEFKPLERIDMQFVMDALREPGADTRNGLQALDRIEGTAQALELRPAAGREDLGDGGRSRRFRGGLLLCEFGIALGALAFEPLKEGARCSHRSKKSFSCSYMSG